MSRNESSTTSKESVTAQLQQGKPPKTRCPFTLTNSVDKLIQNKDDAENSNSSETLPNITIETFIPRAENRLRIKKYRSFTFARSLCRRPVYFKAQCCVKLTETASQTDTHFISNTLFLDLKENESKQLESIKYDEAKVAPETMKTLLISRTCIKNKIPILLYLGTAIIGFAIGVFIYCYAFNTKEPTQPPITEQNWKLWNWNIIDIANSLFMPYTPVPPLQQLTWIDRLIEFFFNLQPMIS